MENVVMFQAAQSEFAEGTDCAPYYSTGTLYNLLIRSDPSHIPATSIHFVSRILRMFRNLYYFTILRFSNESLHAWTWMSRLKVPQGSVDCLMRNGQIDSMCQHQRRPSLQKAEKDTPLCHRIGAKFLHLATN